MVRTENAMTRYRWVLAYGRKMNQHRHIAEMAIGRELGRQEHVHHWNHNPADDDPGNLLLVTPGEHARSHNQKYHSEDERLAAGRRRDAEWRTRNPVRARALAKLRTRRYRERQREQ